MEEGEEGEGDVYPAPRWWIGSTWAEVMNCLHPLPLSLSHLARPAHPWSPHTSSLPRLLPGSAWLVAPPVVEMTGGTVFSGREKVLFPLLGLCSTGLHQDSTRTPLGLLDCPPVPTAVWFGVSHLTSSRSGTDSQAVGSLVRNQTFPLPLLLLPQAWTWYWEVAGRMSVSRVLRWHSAVTL